MAEAIREGAASRVRPMVMTALMAMLGLLPMALSNGVGAETARPFAVVIIRGLITGTVLTLFILPLLYPRFESGDDSFEQCRRTRSARAGDGGVRVGFGVR
jgi:cobalt-zinc-cadmium resistance protein CzcA